MKIAFDIDGVLTDITSFQLTSGEKYFKRQAINKNAFTIKEMFGCTDMEEKKFWHSNLLKYYIFTPTRVGVMENLKKLKEEKHKIFLMNSRKFINESAKINKLINIIVEEWLKYNKIEYDEILYCSENKIDQVVKNNIDVVVLNKVDDINEISTVTNVVCFNTRYNSFSVNKNIIRIDSFYELKNVLNKIKNNLKSTIKMENSSINNMPSIAKPYMKYYTNSQLSIKLPQKTIYENLFENNITNLNNIAINYFDRKITFSELFKMIDDCCRAFVTLGVNKGDIVTICMPNTPEAIIAFYSLNKIGAVSNMIHPLKSKNEIKNYLNEVNSKYMILLDSNYSKVNEIIDETLLEKVIVASPKDSMPFIMGLAYYNQTLKNEPFYKEQIDNKYIKWADFIKNGKNEKIVKNEYKENELAVIIHTGGTTGTSKGVMLSNDNFNSMITQFFATADNFCKGDKMLTIMPVFHGFGLCSSIHLPLSFGVTSVLIPKFESSKFDKLLKKYKPNHIIGVPTLWKAMINNDKINKMDLSFIKYVVTGGDSMKQDFELAVNEFLKNHGSNSELNKGYGLSEAVAGATFAFGECNKLGSIGIPMVKTEFKIVEPGTDKELTYNQNGELCISGPTVMLGYYNNEEETSLVLRKHSDGKLWLHTGDMGYIDNDGVLYYSQRITRMFISSGVNVYPSSIETVISSINEIEMCAVIPIQHEYKGMVPKVYIVLKQGYELNEDIINKIKLNCLENLDKYHQPYQIEFRNTLPITNLGNDIGKVDYKKLEDENTRDIHEKIYKLR